MDEEDLYDMGLSEDEVPFFGRTWDNGALGYPMVYENEIDDPMAPAGYFEFDDFLPTPRNRTPRSTGIQRRRAVKPTKSSNQEGSSQVQAGSNTVEQSRQTGKRGGSAASTEAEESGSARGNSKHGTPKKIRAATTLVTPPSRSSPPKSKGVSSTNCSHCSSKGHDTRNCPLQHSDLGKKAKGRKRVKVRASVNKDHEHGPGASMHTSTNTAKNPTSSTTNALAAGKVASGRVQKASGAKDRAGRAGAKNKPL